MSLTCYRNSPFANDKAHLDNSQQTLWSTHCLKFKYFNPSEYRKMSSQNRINGPSEPPRLYTVYQGGYQHGVNHGFHPDFPPKYEHVVNGIPTEQCQRTEGVPQPAGIVFIAPVRPYGKIESIIQYFCLFFFIILFFTLPLTFLLREKS